MPNSSNSASVRSFKVVAMGGGTGLSTLLHGLKQHVVLAGEVTYNRTLPFISELSAIVTVSDDGGSSGRLRKELNVPPPGDIRNCIVALAEKEALLSRLFQYRFRAGEGLEGHSFGNLFLSAMTDITGDFSEAVKHAAAILATRGHIYPTTTSDAQLYAIMDDGSVVRGETNITASQRRITELRMAPINARPARAALHAIENADVITIGPGSLFTSLIPNLLVRDLSKAIKDSRALKVYVCNLMTQANESLNLTASQHIEAIYKHARHEFFDYALVNQTPASPTMVRKYAEKQQSQIMVDAERIDALGVKPILGDYLAEEMDPNEGLIARHETHHVAHDLLQLMLDVREARTLTADRHA
ncbi:MAG TPA: uridine diphosphate-N-acetylglucosamine-binding protein YvcK [Candidatus Binatia bacterium]|nr:uridine diphosphate-N-acetylglucosamine-binding protein YvcK [Candidatus Binatia bacterium]